MKLKDVYTNSYIGSGGSIFASLCCLGTPALLSILSSIGLGFIISDMILLPLLALSLGVSIYSSHNHRTRHELPYPFFVTTGSSILLVVGIFMSKYLAYVAITALIVATIWDVVLVKRCKTCEGKNDSEI